MSCKQTTRWLQLYIDGQLDLRHLTRLESHLQGCAACRNDLLLFEAISASVTGEDLSPEPPELTALIMQRIAALEAQRSALAAAPIHPVRREQPWRVAALALAVVAVASFAWLQPAAWAQLPATLTRSGQGVLQTLTGPGPDSISWGVWAVGMLVLVVLLMRFWHTDASEALRRSLSDRLPELW